MAQCNGRTSMPLASVAGTNAMKYCLELRNPNGFRTVWTCHWTEEECRTMLERIIRLASRTPDSTTCLYWIRVCDGNGIPRLLTTWDWTDQDRRVALRRISRLVRRQPWTTPTPPIVTAEADLLPVSPAAT
jgi:hypothetical protein